MTLTFADTEPIQALQVIIQERPNLVVLERLFAATPRGAALINRIKTDPQLGHAEVRVMSHTGDYTRQVAKPAVEAAASAGAAVGAVASGSKRRDRGAWRPVDWHGRRARASASGRRRTQADGNPAAVIDSAVGAQVISPPSCGPNQKVASGAERRFVLRFRGAIAWAKFEMPKPPERPATAPASSSRCDASGRQSHPAQPRDYSFPTPNS
jgi:hypothetical protein